MKNENKNALHRKGKIIKRKTLRNEKKNSKEKYLFFLIPRNRTEEYEVQSSQTRAE